MYLKKLICEGRFDINLIVFDNVGKYCRDLYEKLKCDFFEIDPIDRNFVLKNSKTYTSFFLTKNNCRVISENIADGVYKENSNNFLQNVDKFFKYIIKEIELDDFNRIGFRSHFITPIESIEETELKIYKNFYNLTHIETVSESKLVSANPIIYFNHMGNKYRIEVSTLDESTFKKSFEEQKEKFYSKCVLIDIDYSSEKYKIKKLDDFFNVALEKNIEIAIKINKLFKEE